MVFHKRNYENSQFLSKFAKQFILFNYDKRKNQYYTDF